MITKKDYAMYVVREFVDENYVNKEIIDPYRTEDIPIEVLESFKKDIYSSSCLAVALEFLLDFRETDLDAYEYTSTRGGIFITCVDKNRRNEGDDFVHILSVREMLDMLPESL